MTLFCCVSGVKEDPSSRAGKQKKKKKTHQRITPPQEPPTSSEFTKERSLSFEEKVKQLQKMTNQSDKKKRNVGIFSRSAESEYQWLKSRLESKSFQQSVNMVRPCYITNGGFQQFSKDVSWCNFGILYHSKNRGRINITDVKDSLYDDELQYLSQKLKKKNVIVVIDDLTDSSEGQKETIQEAQPRLKELAEEVFLFSTAEKRLEA